MRSDAPMKGTTIGTWGQSAPQVATRTIPPRQLAKDASINSSFNMCRLRFECARLKIDLYFMLSSTLRSWLDRSRLAGYFPSLDSTGPPKSFHARQPPAIEYTFE